MRIKFLCLLICLLFKAVVYSQETLRPDAAVKFSLRADETKSFSLNLKREDFAQLEWTAIKESGYFKYKVIAPSGANLTGYAVALEDSFSFVALENGVYTIECTAQKYDDAASGSVSKYSVKYENKFVLPKNAAVKASRKINGYTAKIYEVGGESNDAYLLIEHDKKLKYIVKATKNVGGLSFPDTPEKDASQAENVSADLFRRTADKTGDGTPDLAVGYYSGGAHCCFSMYFYELGDEVKPVKSLEMGNAAIAAVGTAPNGGLKLASGDDAFAYWKTSYAASPVPEIVLGFRNGEFQANRELMKKPAAPLATLKREAAEIRRKMPLDAYDDKTGASFDESFWGRMLELIYMGHEDLAWQYFEWAWNPNKAGKENFKRDFEKQLVSSQFYRMFRASK